MVNVQWKSMMGKGRKIMEENLIKINKWKPRWFSFHTPVYDMERRLFWTLTKRLKKKLEGNYTRMLRAILNKSWQQHPTRHQLYGQLPPITKTIKARRTRHAGHCWRSKDELISDVPLWTPAYGQAKAGRQARTYIKQLCEDTGCSPEDLPEAINDREKWRERVWDIRASGTTWWWYNCVGFTNGPGDLGSIRLYKWYLIPLCLALSNIKYVSRVKWSNLRKGVAPSPTPLCCSYWKESLLVAHFTYLVLCKNTGFHITQGKHYYHYYYYKEIMLFGLVWFCHISTIVGYSMPNTFYT